MFSCQEPRLRWAIGPFRSLVHVPGTVFLQLFGRPKSFLLSKTFETVLERQSRALDIAMTVNTRVKHHRGGLPTTVLYKLSYLHYITITFETFSLTDPIEVYVDFPCFLYSFLRSLVNIKQLSATTAISLMKIATFWNHVLRGTRLLIYPAPYLPLRQPR